MLRSQDLRGEAYPSADADAYHDLLQVSSSLLVSALPELPWLERSHAVRHGSGLEISGCAFRVLRNIGRCGLPEALPYFSGPRAVGGWTLPSSPSLTAYESNSMLAARHPALPRQQSDGQFELNPLAASLRSQPLNWNFSADKRFPQVPLSTIPNGSPIALSPVYTLPVELLSRVFILGTLDKPYPDLTPLNVPAFEVLVSHVCRHWRGVALSTPSLWTTLTFRLKCHMRRAHVYLSRNGRLLLDIFMDTCAEDEYEEGYNLFEPEFGPIFDILMPQVDRWKSLTLKVRHRSCKLWARKVLSSCGPARNLEYLQLWHIEDWDSAERLFTQIGPPPVVIFGKSLPSLKHLSLVGVNVPWLQSPFLEDLTTIDFALHSEDVRIPYHIWANMLATSPGLEKLSLHYSGPKATGDAWPETVIPLPGLRELSLTDLDPPYMCEILRRVHAPNVARLRLELPAQEPETDFDGFVAYLVAPPVPSAAEQGQEQKQDVDGPLFPDLQSLAVHALECSTQSFRRLLEVSPHLTELELVCNRLPEGFFQELFHVSIEDKKGKQREGTVTAAADAVQHILLTELQTLRISGISSTTLADYVNFRRRHGRPVLRWHVSERMRGPELEAVAADMVARGEGEQMTWFTSEEDEDEDEDEEDEEDGEEEAVDHAKEQTGGAASPAFEVDERVEYYDEESGRGEDEEDEGYEDP